MRQRHARLATGCASSAVLRLVEIALRAQLERRPRASPCANCLEKNAKQRDVVAHGCGAVLRGSMYRGF